MMEFISNYTSFFGTYVLPITLFICAVLSIYGLVFMLLFGFKNLLIANLGAGIVTVLLLPVLINLFYGTHKAMIKEAKYIHSKPRVERFIVAEINPPKHMYVTVKHIDTNMSYENLYIAKHCNNLSLKVGDKVNLIIHEKWDEKTPESKTWIFDNLRESFCGG